MIDSERDRRDLLSGYVVYLSKVQPWFEFIRDHFDDAFFPLSPKRKEKVWDTHLKAWYTSPVVKMKTHSTACKPKEPHGAALITGVTTLGEKPESNSLTAVSSTPVVLSVDVQHIHRAKQSALTE